MLASRDCTQTQCGSKLRSGDTYITRARAADGRRLCRVRRKTRISSLKKYICSSTLNALACCELNCEMCLYARVTPSPPPPLHLSPGIRLTILRDTCPPPPLPGGNTNKSRSTFPVFFCWCVCCWRVYCRRQFVTLSLACVSRWLGRAAGAAAV